MRNVTINLGPEDRERLKSIMDRRGESKPSSALRRVLERYLGLVPIAAPARVISIRINESIDAEIKRRGLSYAEAVRRALHFKG